MRISVLVQMEKLERKRKKLLTRKEGNSTKQNVGRKCTKKKAKEKNRLIEALKRLKGCNNIFNLINKYVNM
jgi:hypothetical protein